MKLTFVSLSLALGLVLTGPVLGAGDNVEINPPAEGSVNREDGLAAWDRIYEVASHPRCANCHTGADNRPMWSGPSYGRARKHGMNVNAGESRIGAEFVLCSTCHAYRENLHDVPHAAPQVAMNWQLAPVEAEWFGKSSEYICNQLRDPERNDGRDYLALAEHLDHDLILHWAWNPGGGREPAPYDLQSHVNDILVWGVAGYPCVND
ncbi:putative Isoquinoline 1-oxidoreductase subunit [Candidatus Rhodobacter oscarellae]|uniref:Putative Isoquinoline 1-oxidoreductase subunit n=1 Tax=Candidatus Rhodobacter oscarellae TaxID=1675527 RepID=A0A0J9EAV7_9RHOB|nr:hypothetical protein [Candidatus Rhodobacter lobularis]KMW58804.1 putative Isoquinoline 1-oxidoreductase subunit [Candidatus Rhodobacter lobularis]